MRRIYKVGIQQMGTNTWECLWSHNDVYIVSVCMYGATLRILDLSAGARTVFDCPLPKPVDVISVSSSTDISSVSVVHAAEVPEYKYKDKNGTVILYGSYEYGVRRLAQNSDTSLIAIANSDNFVTVYNTRNAVEPTTLYGHLGDIRSVEFIPNSNMVVTASRDTTVRVWDVKTGRTIRQLCHSHPVYAASPSPDGKFLVAGDNSGIAVIWDLEKCEEKLRLTGHAAGIDTASWSSDGRRVITGSYDGTAAVWDVESGARVVVVRDHNCVTYGVSWSPSKPLLYTTNNDRTCTIWDIDTVVEGVK